LKIPQLVVLAGLPGRAPEARRRRFSDAPPMGGRGHSVVKLEGVVMILDLHRQGLSVSAIARQSGFDRKTVRRISERALFQKLATCEWIRVNQHLLIGGSTGIGKSWLACALADKTCGDGFSVIYPRAPRLFAELGTARGEGRLARLMTTPERMRLLIIDDWGPEPLNAEQRRNLLEIIDDRDQKGALLMTSQVPIPRWYVIIGDPTLGDAIIDAPGSPASGSTAGARSRCRDHRAERCRARSSTSD
jgi:hypothetical protein